MTQVASGTYTGTGAAVNVEIGFAPDYIKIVNLTDGDDAWEFFTGMTAGHAIYTRNVVDNGATGNASMSRITANGISQRNPTDYVGKRGFTAGTACSESGKTFGWIAVRNDY